MKYKVGDWIRWLGLEINGQVIKIQEKNYTIVAYYTGSPLEFTTSYKNVDRYTKRLTKKDKLELL